jgi:hypothetical protein
MARFLPAALAACLAACGSGGTDLAGGGIGGTGYTAASVGTVEGFGSVIVGGVRYDTSAAEIFVDNRSVGSGDGASIQNLAVGMVVRVEGRVAEDGSARADRVYFGRNLRGAVESVTDLDSVSRQAVILGQTVILDDRTSCSNTTAASIGVGMVLDVSGYDDETGRIAATYVNRVFDALPPGEEVDIRGVVQNRNAQAQTYDIQGFTIDYAAADLGALPGAAPENGQLIRARGTRVAADRLVASRLETEEEFGSGVFDDVYLEGIVARVHAPGEFAIGRYTVRTGPETEYNNLKPQDVAPGTRVVVRGALAGRVITALNVYLAERIRMESDVSAINPAQESLTLAGLEAARVFATATTRFVGTARALNEIAPGNHARVLGRKTAGGGILASTVVVTPAPSDVAALAGPADSISVPSLIVLGIGVDTSAIPPDGFRGPDGRSISSGEFFGALAPGDIVAAEGVREAGGVRWTSIAFESEP